MIHQMRNFLLGVNHFSSDESVLASNMGKQFIMSKHHVNLSFARVERNKIILFDATAFQMISSLEWR